jgi:hypothetical protein
MPGKILLFYIFRGLKVSPQTMGYLIVLLSNIGGVLTYLISKELSNNRLKAIYSLILYLFIPAKLLFFPIPNTITPIFMLLSFLLFLKSLNSFKKRYLILLGASLYLVVFFEPLVLITGIVFVAFLLKYYLEKKVSKIQIFKIVFFSIVSFLTIHIVMISLFKFNIIQSFLLRLNFNESVAWNLQWNRRYDVWVFQNLVDFFVSLGVIQTTLFFIYLKNAISKALNFYRNDETPNKNFLKYILEPDFLIAFSSMITLLFIDVIGWFRGEVQRLLIFLMVFVQIIVSHFCASKLDKNSFYVMVFTTLLQTIITINMVNVNPHIDAPLDI